MLGERKTQSFLYCDTEKAAKFCRIQIQKILDCFLLLLFVLFNNPKH